MAPAPASETVKRAPTMDWMEEEEAILPSPMEKEKMDDEEGDDGNSDEEIRAPYELLSEEEWGVDSYDDREYKPNPDDRERFDTDDDYNEYCQRRWNAIANKGFEPDIFTCVYPMHNVKREENLIALCIDKYNKEYGKTLEYISPVKGNMRAGAKFKFYITIMAREFPNGPPVEYQVKIMTYAGGHTPPVPIFCRPTPKPENKSSPK